MWHMCLQFTSKYNHTLLFHKEKISHRNDHIHTWIHLFIRCFYSSSFIACVDILDLDPENTIMWVQACFGQNQENILKCHQTKKSRQDYGDVEWQQLNDVKIKDV